MYGLLWQLVKAIGGLAILAVVVGLIVGLGYAAAHFPHFQKAFGVLIVLGIGWIVGTIVVGE